MKLNCIIIALCATVLLTGCKQVAKSSIKKGAKETAKEVIEVSGEKTSKASARTSMKLTAEMLPKDRKALAVVKDEQGRIVPAINN